MDTKNMLLYQQWAHSTIEQQRYLEPPRCDICDELLLDYFGIPEAAELAEPAQIVCMQCGVENKERLA